MRVLQVGKYYPPVDGGIENNVHAISVGLARHYDVTALVFNTSGVTQQEVSEGVRIVRVGTLGRVLSTEMAPGFIRWFLRLRDVDVIHLHTPNPVAELACLATPRRAKLVVSYHSDVIRQRLLGRLNRVLLHRLLRRADRVISYTRSYLETSPVISQYAGKSAIIPHGLDLDELRITPEVASRAAALRERYGPRLVLFVGRLVYYKGIDVLLKALARLPASRLLVVGEGPEKDGLVKLAAQLKVTERVGFLGRASQQEKLAAYHACDLLALPATARSEAFGQVQAEAMACWRPVISTDIPGGVPFVNAHLVSGLVVPPRDVDALAAAMDRLLSDEQLRRQLGTGGRRRVEALFSRDVMIDDLLALYREILARPPAAAPAPAPASAARHTQG